jgi:pimeloyl-ACP methyl ester carboxylesterase
MEFTESSVGLSVGTIPYRVAGAGPVVVYVPSAAGRQISAPLQTLAESYRVFVPDLSAVAAGPRSRQAELLAEFIAEIADDKVDVIGHGSGARAASWLAVRHSDKLDALVLVAPEDFGRAGVTDELEAELPKISCLTLVLAGNADTVTTPDSVRLTKRAVPRSFLVYVHDAGHDIEADKPQQFTRVVTDFLKWGEGFLVRRSAAPEAA